MANLTLALRARGAEGEALPSVFKNLAAIGAHHRRGQVSLIAAAPNGGKSAYATHYSIHAGVPTLYFSPDSDRLTLGTRALAGLLNSSVDEVTAAIDKEDEYAMEVLAEATDHIWWSFDTGITLDDITREVQAYGFVNGEYPHLIILDNLKDVAGRDENQIEYHRTIDYLHTLARETTAHVLVLHHTVGSYEDGKTPIPLSGLLNKVGKTPRLVMTFYKDNPGILNICVVKNSTGMADASGELQVKVGWLPERSWFSN